MIRVRTNERVVSLDWSVPTLCFHTVRLFFVRVQNRVFRGLGTSAITCSWGSGRGGADESCLAADVGKYIESCEIVTEFCKSVGLSPRT